MPSDVLTRRLNSKQLQRKPEPMAMEMPLSSNQTMELKKPPAMAITQLLKSDDDLTSSESDSKKSTSYINAN